MDAQRRRFFVDGIPSAGTILHAPYIRPAQNLLAQVKQQMRDGGLSQLQRHYTNENGVTLVAASRFGLDEININVPIVDPRPQRQPTREIKPDNFVPLIVVGGTVRYVPPFAEQVYHPFKWTRSDGVTILDLCPGDGDGWANAISGDGSTIVGNSSPITDDDSYQHKCVRWVGNSLTPQVIALGAPGGDSTLSFASDVNYNGSTIVGLLDLFVGASSRRFAFKWTRPSGGVLLASELLRPSDNADMGLQPPAISPNGRYICAGIANLLRPYAGKVWMSNGEVFDTPFDTYPISVADDGTVLLYVAESAYAATPLWNVRTGSFKGMPELVQSTGSGDWAYVVSGDHATVVGKNAEGYAALWTNDGEVRLFPNSFDYETAEAFSASDDGKCIVGYTFDLYTGRNQPYLIEYKSGEFQSGILPEANTQITKTRIELPSLYDELGGYAFDVTTPKTPKPTTGSDTASERPASGAPHGYFKGVPLRPGNDAPQLDE